MRALSNNEGNGQHFRPKARVLPVVDNHVMRIIFSFIFKTHGGDNNFKAVFVSRAARAVLIQKNLHILKSAIFIDCCVLKR